jgi:S1-C subfamily serine protease
MAIKNKLCLFLWISLVLSSASLQAQQIQFDALKGGKKAVASCVLLDAKGTLATVVELGADMKKATLHLHKKSVPLTFVANDLNSRLAIYKLPANSDVLAALSVAKMGESLSLKSGQTVFSSPSDQKAPSRLVARVTRFQGKILPLAVLRVNHPQSAPQPGSGLYDKNGKLIGLVRQAVFGQSASSYCLPVEVITRTWSDFKRNGKVQRCWIGIVMDELVAPPIIESVRPGSPAQKCGLKNGDVILNIGGREVRGYSEVVDAFFYLVAGESQVFKVLRGTEIKEIVVTPEVSPGG